MGLPFRVRQSAGSGLETYPTEGNLSRKRFQELTTAQLMVRGRLENLETTPHLAWSELPPAAWKTWPLWPNAAARL